MIVAVSRRSTIDNDSLGRGFRRPQQPQQLEPGRIQQRSIGRIILRQKEEGDRRRKDFSVQLRARPTAVNTSPLTAPRLSCGDGNEDGIAGNSQPACIRSRRCRGVHQAWISRSGERTRPCLMTTASTAFDTGPSSAVSWRSDQRRFRHRQTTMRGLR